jgi:hypothetical protein
MRDLVWLDRLMILYMYPFNLFWYIRWDLSSKRLYYYFHLVRSSASRSIHNNSLPLFSFLLLSDTLSPFFTLWAVLVQESEQTLNNLWTFQIPSRIKRAIFSSTARARIERAARTCTSLGACHMPYGNRATLTRTRQWHQQMRQVTPILVTSTCGNWGSIWYSWEP